MLSNKKEPGNDQVADVPQPIQLARIIVIGAGIAGIAAATRLLESGFRNVIVLEAENRYGGRVHTIPFADNVVDLGAQWCIAEVGNAVYDLVHNADVTGQQYNYYDRYVCVRSNKEVLSGDVTAKLKSIVFRTAPQREEGLKNYQGSLGVYLRNIFWRDLMRTAPEIDRCIAREFLDNYEKTECCVAASDDLFEVSGRGHLNHCLCLGDLVFNWKDKGYSSIMTFLMKAKPEDPNDLGLLQNRILLNKRVETVDYSTPNGIQIKCHDGELFEADHVICTVSLGVLQKYHQSMFKPPLPAVNVRAIEGIKLGTANKFFLEFEWPFEPLNWLGFNFLWCASDLLKLRKSSHAWLEGVFGFYRVSFQPRLLQGWIVGPHARDMELQPDAEVLKGLMWLLQKFLSYPVPEPIRFVRTQWYTNENFCGAYSCRTMITEELNTGSWDLATPVKAACGKLLVQFAGEATHNNHYSTAHGAVESGWREAHNLAMYYLNRLMQTP